MAAVSGIACRVINACQGFKSLNNKVSRFLDFSFGREATEAEANGRFGLRITQVEGTEDVGRFGNARGTGRSGGRRKSWLKGAENILRAEAVKPQIGITGMTSVVSRAVNGYGKSTAL